MMTEKQIQSRLKQAANVKDSGFWGELAASAAAILDRDNNATPLAAVLQAAKACGIQSVANDAKEAGLIGKNGVLKRTKKEIQYAGWTFKAYALNDAVDEQQRHTAIMAYINAVGDKEAADKREADRRKAEADRRKAEKKEIGYWVNRLKRLQQEAGNNGFTLEEIMKAGKVEPASKVKKSA